MPIYEYRCNQCGEVFEIFHKIDEEVKVACPKCLGEAKKLISASNFILKGSGFYVNDYPSKSRHEGKRKDREPFASKGDKAKVEKKEEKPAEKKAE